MKKIVLSQDMSDDVAEKNAVRVRDMLDAIFIFHEAIEEYPSVTGHPYLHLFSDGSGRVVSDRDDCVLFSFGNLEQLVKKAKELMEKYKIGWE